LIGAGTGIFTRALIADAQWNPVIKELRAIDPSDGMRSVFSQTVTDSRVSIKEGTFQETGIVDGWADIIVIAQAFHWCPDYNRASEEFARILKPDGMVALIWNREDRDGAPWVAELLNRVEQHEAGAPQSRLNLWRATFDTPSYKKFFKDPIEKNWTYSLQATSNITVDRSASKSYIAILPDDEKEKLRQDIRDILNKEEDIVWIDKAAGTFEYPYETWVVIAERK